jgi:NDP-sugar pyrophosphorylase family protein
MLRTPGIGEIAVNVYHLPEKITGAFDGEGIHFSVETELLGTAGGVKRMEAFLDETFLVLYGDNFYHCDLAPLVAFHKERGALMTLATFTAENPSACGLVVTDESGRVTRFQEKPPPESVFTDQANAGVYVCEPEIFAHLPEGTACDFGKDLFPHLLSERVFATPLAGTLRDTGTPENYRLANWETLPPGAPRLVVGDGCQIAPDATLAESILWREVTVESGARVIGAILGNNVRIGTKARVENGAILADDVVVDAGAIIPPGARLSATT